jgi:hypothetical protein
MTDFDGGNEVLAGGASSSATPGGGGGSPLPATRVVGVVTYGHRVIDHGRDPVSA